MRKSIALVSLLILTVFMIFSFSACSKVDVAEGEVVAVFQYGDADINTTLSNEDSEIVRKIFNGKMLFSDSPSCGFRENVALIIDGDTYCIACDTCGKIYAVEENKYFNLSDTENETLRNLLCEYGFTFPCI